MVGWQVLPILIVVSVCVDKMTGGFQVPVSGDLGGPGQARSGQVRVALVFAISGNLPLVSRGDDGSLKLPLLLASWIVPTSYP